MSGTVVYISSCAFTAEGMPDAFMLQELPWLRRHFGRVLVCSGYGIAEITEDQPAIIRPSKPACGGLRALMKAGWNQELRRELRHLRAEGKWTFANALKLFVFTVRGYKLFFWIQALLHPGENVTAYAYWMSYDGFAAALCKQKNPAVRAIARGHAFDIDVQRNPMNPYLMKRFMVEKLDRIFPISETSADQIAAYVAIPPEKLRIVGAGSAGEKAEAPLPAPRFLDGVFHVVSCSAMVEIKQLPLLIDALAAWNRGSLHWLHIGGGPDETAIRVYAGEKLNAKPNIAYSLIGRQTPEQIRQIYKTTAFDVFINTSKNEGTPVAIMEAMHAGIPVVAPAVGGIPELVDPEIGFLYPKDGNAEDVCKALTAVYEKSEAEARRMSGLAQAHWNERCLLSNLLPDLFPEEAKEGRQP